LCSSIIRTYFSINGELGGIPENIVTYLANEDTIQMML